MTPESTARKRKADGGGTGTPTKSKRAKPVQSTKVETNPHANVVKFTLDIELDAQVIPAKLAFSFDEAKSHLIDADSRFTELFERVKCKPFQDLEPVDPFRYVFVNSLNSNGSNSKIPERLLYLSCLYALLESFGPYLISM
jgi:DNA-3-methyladenine glycosylase II